MSHTYPAAKRTSRNNTTTKVPTASSKIAETEAEKLIKQPLKLQSSKMNSPFSDNTPDLTQIANNLPALSTITLIRTVWSRIQRRSLQLNRRDSAI